MRCLAGGCTQRAVPGAARCVPHMGEDSELAIAEEFALDALVRQESGLELISSARQAGSRDWLVARNIGARLRWLRHLLNRDRPDDLVPLLPHYLVEAAREHIASVRDAEDVLA